MIYTQLLPGRTINTVLYGVSDQGYPVIMVMTAEGDIVTLTADGHAVYPDLVIETLKKGN